jgi:hypothetical protein
MATRAFEIVFYDDEEDVIVDEERLKTNPETSNKVFFDNEKVGGDFVVIDEFDTDDYSKKEDDFSSTHAVIFVTNPPEITVIKQDLVFVEEGLVIQMTVIS